MGSTVLLDSLARVRECASVFSYTYNVCFRLCLVLSISNSISSIQGFLSNVELKLSDSTANLYLSLACVLACGLNGIVNKKKLRPALNLQAGQPLPQTLDEALTALVRDKFLVEEVLGLELSRGYLALRKAEAERGAQMTIEEELAEALERA